MKYLILLLSFSTFCSEVKCFKNLDTLKEDCYQISDSFNYKVFNKNDLDVGQCFIKDGLHLKVFKTTKDLVHFYQVSKEEFSDKRFSRDFASKDNFVGNYTNVNCASTLFVNESFFNNCLLDKSKHITQFYCE